MYTHTHINNQILCRLKREVERVIPFFYSPKEHHLAGLLTDKVGQSPQTHHSRKSTVYLASNGVSSSLTNKGNIIDIVLHKQFSQTNSCMEETTLEGVIGPDFEQGVRQAGGVSVVRSGHVIFKLESTFTFKDLVVKHRHHVYHGELFMHDNTTTHTI